MSYVRVIETYFLTAAVEEDILLFEAADKPRSGLQLKEG